MIKKPDKLPDYIHVTAFFPEQGANVQGYCRKDQLLINGKSYAQLEVELKWYGEKAEALKKYGQMKPVSTTAMTAVVTELMLDNGNRAKKVLKAGGK